MVVSRRLIAGLYCPHPNCADARPQAGGNVAGPVADHPARGWGEAEAGDGLFEQQRIRLAAQRLGEARVAGRHVEGVEHPAALVLQLLVAGSHVRQRVKSFRDARLVGDDDQVVTGLLEPVEGLGYAGYYPKVGKAPRVVASLFVEDAVAVEENGAI